MGKLFDFVTTDFDKLTAISALEKLTGALAPAEEDKEDNINLCGWTRFKETCTFCGCSADTTNPVGYFCVKLWVEVGDHVMCQKCFEKHECDFLPRE